SPWMSTFWMRPDLASSMNCEYETVSCGRAPPSNCLNTVNSTNAITIHTATLENILFKVDLLHGIADRPIPRNIRRIRLVFLYFTIVLARVFQTHAHDERFGRLIPRRFRLPLHHAFELLFERLNDLRKATAVESLDDQGSFRLQVGLGKFQ